MFNLHEIIVRNFALRTCTSIAYLVSEIIVLRVHFQIKKI